MESATTPPQAYRCEKCGLVSIVKEGFILKKGSLGLVHHTRCLECEAKQQSRSLVLTLLLLMIIGLLMVWAAPDLWLGRIYLMLVAGLLLTIPTILIHELAHALVAHLVGLRVFAIYLGNGPLVTSFRFLGLRWHVRRFPVGGATIVAGRKAPLYRLRHFLTFLAGPGSHALAIWLMILALRFIDRQAHPWLALAAFICLWSNVLLCLVNLYPHMVASAAGAAGSDGWAMFHVLTWREQELNKRYASYYILSAVDAVERKDLPAARAAAAQAYAMFPLEPLVANIVGYVHSACREYPAAREVFLRLLDGCEQRDAITRAVIWNNVASGDLMLEDESQRERAEALSAQAYQAMPWEPSIVSTRGAVLVWLGRVEEGLPLLKKAMSRSPTPASKAYDACYIAWGQIQQGDLAQARQYLDAARRLDPTCDLVERMNQKIVII